MSAIKNFYHEEIVAGVMEMQQFEAEENARLEAEYEAYLASLPVVDEEPKRDLFSEELPTWMHLMY